MSDNANKDSSESFENSAEMVALDSISLGRRSY